MITQYDYISIGFYFLFVVVVGIVFTRRNKNTSDYFRGGGIMPWWMAGVSAWMASFSAWTFTGAAGKIYSQGFYVLLLYYSSIAALLVLLFFTCYRFRRMRVVTPVEAIRLRATRLQVFKRGKLLAQTPAATSQLHLDGRPAQTSMML